MAAVCLLAAWFVASGVRAEPPSSGACAGEGERITALIEELGQLKAQLADAEARLERLLRALSEHRGALQNRPVFDALKQTVEPPADQPDRKPPVVRCAALTASGKRCTRPAAPGSRYCRQHQLAHQK